MTTIQSIPNRDSITDSADLPRPDAADFISSDTGAGLASARPLPAVNDSGRIRFGAACRPSIKK
ncbi:MAG: hypothetical protein QOH05_2627 [Acetobacteraceae bacterium]|jgi:hypothetical protein|nr:hypothetical protein [Acetobacteraceae bacterium]